MDHSYCFYFLFGQGLILPNLILFPLSYNHHHHHHIFILFITNYIIFASYQYNLLSERNQIKFIRLINEKIMSINSIKNLHQYSDCSSW